MPTVEIECKSPSISKARVCSVFIHAGCQAISLFSGWSFRRTVVSLGPWIEHIRWRVDKHHTKSDVIRPKSNIPPRHFIISFSSSPWVRHRDGDASQAPR